MTVLVIPHTAHMAIVAPIDPALLTTPRGLKNIPVPITAATLEPIKVHSSSLTKYLFRIKSILCVTNKVR